MPQLRVEYGHVMLEASLHVSALKVQAGTNRPISAKIRRLADDKRHLPESEVLPHQRLKALLRTNGLVYRYLLFVKQKIHVLAGRKSQIPKSQIPNKFQIPIPQIPNFSPAAHLEFGAWNLLGIWCLGFGILSA